MDTSKEYIKMCEKAMEIQKNWKTKAFDIYQDKGGTIRVVAEDYGCEFASEGISSYGWEKEVIWLPSQDRLQEMMIYKYESFSTKIYADMIWDFSSFTDPSESVHKYCKSMEQLWLAFVMKEKYNKIWNGKDWIKSV